MNTLEEQQPRRWYEGISRYQWLVLLIACLGWIFDVFEGQVFVASMNEAMPSLLPEGTSKATVARYNDIAFGAFLIGGAVGGILFGMLSDRIGRTRVMIYTILMYSLFTCVTTFAQTWWQMAILRFWEARTATTSTPESALKALKSPETASTRTATDPTWLSWLLSPWGILPTEPRQTPSLNKPNSIPLSF